MSRLGALARKYSVACGLGSSVGIHVFRYQGGDAVAQTQEKSDFNRWRSLAFACWGGYCGSVYYVVYGPIYTKIMARTGVGALPMVLFDYAVTAQLLYFPAYYMVQEYVRSPSPSWQAALAKCNENRLDDFKALCSIFAPISWFNYAVVPTHWRGLFSGCGGTIWAVYLSHSRGVRQDEDALPLDTVHVCEAAALS